MHHYLGFPASTVVRNLPANAGDAGDAGSIPGSRRSPGGRLATCSNILTWKILCREEFGGLAKSMGLQRVEHN